MNDTKQVEKLRVLLEQSSKVLITTHVSPDFDAVSSLLLLGNTLKLNFPGQTIHLVMEEKISDDLSFLEGFGSIEYSLLPSALKKYRPDLLIIVDANSYARTTREDSVKLAGGIKKSKTPVVVIDHHEQDQDSKFDIVINNKRPATAEEVYVLFFEELKLRKPNGYAEAALLGIMSDTQRHRFDHPGYRETYRVVSNLLDAGASIEKLESRLEKYNYNQLQAISNLAGNIKDSGKGYSYSFIDEPFYSTWLSDNKPPADLKKACEDFTNRFIRNFEANDWGFLIYPDAVAGPGNWSVSLRSLSDAKDVSEIAVSLGGGGHKPAAGAKFQAENLKEALKKVMTAING